jgi:phosphate transport system substrate-binding protein
VPAPLYNAWGREYVKHNADVQVRYLPVGTEEGVKEIARGAGDFAAGEEPLPEKMRSQGGLIELPAALIGIVVVYHLPGSHQELRLSGELLAEIFTGVVKNWNAAAIGKLNPGVELPDLPIKVVQRPGGKGSNYVFTDFLSKASPRFRSQIGVSLSPKWPVGEAAERSGDVVEKVKGQPGAIGYVEYQYAVNGNVATAAVLNAGGNFVKATSKSLLAACESVEAPGWHNLTASLAYAKGAEAYPISSFTWIYVRAKGEDAARSGALKSLLSWIYVDGQTMADGMGYTGLPTQLLAETRKKLAELR